jgi:nucleoside-diphosphate-sugar epimerase
MTRVVVTGGSGKLGRACVRDLVEHGYDVLNADRVPSPDPCAPLAQVDLEDLGEVLGVLGPLDDRHDRLDAVVHLAAIPAPGMAPNATIFRLNTVSTYNVFEACRRLGIRNVVWASSETVLGLPFDVPPPAIPLDEEPPGRPESSYSLSKLLGEVMADQFCRWDPGLKIACLRFSNVMEPEEYAAFPAFDADASARKWNLWGYIDARDGAQAIRKALETEFTGAEVFVIANHDTVMSRPNAELVAEVFPGVPFDDSVGPNETLLSIEKAKRVLGYAPEHSWRDAV